MNSETVRQAARLAHVVGFLTFSQSMSLVCVGVPPDIAATESPLQSLDVAIRGYCQENGEPNHGFADISLLATRSKIIWDNATFVPNMSKKELGTIDLEDVNSKELMNIVWLAGVPPENCGAGPLYMRLKCHVDKHKAAPLGLGDQDASQATINVTTMSDLGAPMTNVFQPRVEPELISPMNSIASSVPGPHSVGNSSGSSLPRLRYRTDASTSMSLSSQFTNLPKPRKTVPQRQGQHQQTKAGLPSL